MTTEATAGGIRDLRLAREHARHLFELGHQIPNELVALALGGALSLELELEEDEKRLPLEEARVAQALTWALDLDRPTGRLQNAPNAELAGFLFSSAGLSAKSTAVLQPFARALELLGSSSTRVGESQLALIVRAIAVALMTRDFPSAARQAALLLRIRDLGHLARDHARYAVVLAALCNDLERLAREVPAPETLGHIRGKLQVLEMLAVRTRDALLLTVARRVDRSIEVFLERATSVQFVRERARLSTSYWAELTGRGGQHGIPELWPSQLKALEDGYLSADSWVLSLPTSSGKTLLAELKAATVLSQDPQALVVYVAPYNALALQVAEKFRERLAPSGLAQPVVWTGAYEIESAGKALGQLVVMTPEKLDSVLRTALEEEPRAFDLRDRLRLVVLDECHLIGVGERGLTYELLMSRLRARFRGVQFCAMSAVLGNPDRLASWLADGEERVTVSDWRPTDTRIYVYMRSGALLDEDRELVTQLTKWSKAKKATALIAGRMLASGQWPVLVLETTRKGYAEDAAESCSELFRDDNSWAPSPATRSAIERLKILVGELMGEDHPLLSMLDQGVAFHHSAVPPAIRSQIEALVRQRNLRLVASTTTLAEGVDLPFRSIVVPHLMIGTRRLPRWLFQNILGRAGRAFVGTEATVAFLEPENEDSRKHLWDALIAQRRQPVAAVSQLPNLAGAPVRPEDWALNWEFQAQLLGLLADETHSDQQADRFVASTFAATADRRGSWRVALRLKASALLESFAVEEPAMARAASPYRLTAFGKAACLTGLSADSVRLIRRELLSQHADALREPANWLPVQPADELLRSIAFFVLTPLEAFASAIDTPRRWSLLRQEIAAWRQGASAGFENATGLDRELIVMWLKGQSLRDIAVEQRERGPLRHAIPRSRLEELNEFYSSRSGFWSWMFSGVVRVAEYLAEEDQFFPDAIRTVVDMLRYGVDGSAAASLVSTMGIPREAAVPLSRAFKEAANEPGGIASRVLQSDPAQLQAIINDDVAFRRTARALDDFRPF